MAAPTAATLDNFNRADGALGANWSLAIGSGNPATISSNGAIGPASGGGPSYWNPGTFGPDCEAYCTITTFVAGQVGALYLRLKDVGTTGLDGYRVQIQVNGTIIVSRVDNNVLTTLATFAAGTRSNGDGLWATIVGSTITAYYKPGAGDWTLAGTVSDATYAAAGYIGFVCGNSTSWKIDDFGGGTRVYSVVTDTITDTLATAGTPTKFAASSNSITNTFTAAGTPKKFAIVSRTITGTFTTAGTPTKFAATARTVTVTFTSAGSPTKFSSSSRSLTVTFTTAGTPKKFAATARPETVSFTTAGTPTKFAATSRTITFAPTVNGRTVKLGALTLTITDTFTSRGLVTAKGVVTTPLVVTFTTAGGEKYFSAVPFALVVTYDSAGDILPWLTLGASTTTLAAAAVNGDSLSATPAFPSTLSAQAISGDSLAATAIDTDDLT